MRVTFKRILQAFLMIVLFSCSTLAVLRITQNGGPWASSSDAAATATGDNVVWQDRAPKSVEEITIGSDNGDWKTDGDYPIVTGQQATATPKPHTTLSDIFISVKTTKNFHQSRLDVILKTWFTLARDEVGLF